MHFFRETRNLPDDPLSVLQTRSQACGASDGTKLQHQPLPVLAQAKRHCKGIGKDQKGQKQRKTNIRDIGEKRQGGNMFFLLVLPVDLRNTIALGQMSESSTCQVLSFKKRIISVSSRRDLFSQAAAKETCKPPFSYLASFSSVKEPVNAGHSACTSVSWEQATQAVQQIHTVRAKHSWDSSLSLYLILEHPLFFTF